MDLLISENNNEKCLSIVYNNVEKIDWKWVSSCQEMKEIIIAKLLELEEKNAN